MKKLIILRGPSGAGKTTHANQHYPDAWTCSADHYFETNNGYEFDPRKLPEAHQACMFRFLNGIIAFKETIIIDNTFTQNWEYINYQTMGVIADYEITILEFMPATIQVLKLIAQRNIHNVPEAIIAAMVMRFEPSNEATRIPIQ